MADRAVAPVPSPRRSLALLALGALVGLCLAGYGLFSAPAGNSTALPPGAVARVNQGQILLTDFRTQTETLYDTSFDKTTLEQRKQVLDSMIAEELLVQRGLEIGLPNTNAEVRDALVSAVNLQSTTDVEARPPTEAQLRAYHAAHPERYVSIGSMRVHDLFIPPTDNTKSDDAMRRAQQAVRALRQGKRVAEVIATFSLQANPNVGGETQLDLVVKRILGDVLYSEASKLGTGKTSEPIATTDGVHILHSAARTPSVALDFVTTKSQVASDFKRDARQRAQQEYVRFLREKATVIVDAPFVDPVQAR